MSLLLTYARRVRRQPLRKTAAFLFQPKKLWFHASRLILRKSGQIQNFYPESNREADLAFCAEVLGCTHAVAAECFAEIENDHEFIELITARYRAKRHRELHLGRFLCTWAIVRLRQPKLVIETGVHDGLSSAMILYALHKNRSGRLISIDLPAVDMPGAEPPGWLVPRFLNQHWLVHLGDAKALLPKVLKDCGPVDLFVHDSDHTEAHQRFELTTVRPYLSEHGMMLCDDPHVSMIDALAKGWSARTYVNAGALDDEAARLAKNTVAQSVPAWARTDGSAKMSLAAIVF